MKDRLTKIPIHIVLIFYSVISIFPFYYVIITAFKDKQEIYHNIFGLPESWTLSNVIYLFTQYGFARSTLNSIIVTLLSNILALVIAALAAYAYAKMKFKGKRLLLSITVALTGVPVMVVILPIYVFISRIQMLDSYLSISVIYATFMLPFAIFLLVSFFKSIPQELLNAASIDGCNRFQILLKIILPLSKPIFTTLVVIDSLWVWNELLIALMFLRRDEMVTVTVALKNIGGRYAHDPVLIQTGALFVAIPMILIFLVGQRFFIKGMYVGSLKE